jgi:hypothetical protein
VPPPKASQAVPEPSGEVGGKFMMAVEALGHEVYVRLADHTVSSSWDEAEWKKLRHAVDHVRLSEIKFLFHEVVSNDQLRSYIAAKEASAI